eukprot:7347461-Pyramimonas_sp.AAC.1
MAGSDNIESGNRIGSERAADRAASAVDRDRIGSPAPEYTTTPCIGPPICRNRIGTDRPATISNLGPINQIGTAHGTE